MEYHEMADSHERPGGGRGPEPGDRPVAGSPPPAEGGAPPAFGTDGSDDDRIVLGSRTETETEDETETGTGSYGEPAGPYGESADPYGGPADPYARPEDRPYGAREQVSGEDETTPPYGRHAGGATLEPDAGQTDEPPTGTVLDAGAAGGADEDTATGHGTGDTETDADRRTGGTAGEEHRDMTEEDTASSGLARHEATDTTADDEEATGAPAPDEETTATDTDVRDEETAATAGGGLATGTATDGGSTGADTPADPEIPGAGTATTGTATTGTATTGTATGGTATGGDGTAADRLLRPEESAGFERRWHEVKSSFVDDPRQAAEDASGLCEEVVTALTTALDRRRRELGDGWRGGDADTERLRTALRAYGSLLTRIKEL